MNGLLQFAASNALVAALAAVIVMGITRVWRNPHLAHLLWALVLVKLVTPPLMFVAVPVFSAAPLPHPAASKATEIISVASPSASGVQRRAPADSEPAAWQRAGVDSGVAASRAGSPPVVARTKPLAARHSPVAQRLAAKSSPAESRAGDERPTKVARPAAHDLAATYHWPAIYDWPSVLVIVWALGTALWLGLLAVRAARFNRLVRAMPQAPEEWQRELAALAARLELRTWPSVRLAEGAISPLLWTIGTRPVIVLPRALVERLDADGHRALLAHELAHYYRRDHWMRWLEMLVLAVYWWNPVAWWARRQLRVAEELCCDAWAVWLLDGEARAYGRTLLATIDFLTATDSVSPLGASGMATSGNLKGRFEMILQSPFGRRLKWPTRLAVAAAALAVLPFSLSAVRVAAQAQAEAGSKKEAESKKEADSKKEAAAAIPAQPPAQAPAETPRVYAPDPASAQSPAGAPAQPPAQAPAEGPRVFASGPVQVPQAITETPRVYFEAAPAYRPPGTPAQPPVQSLKKGPRESWIEESLGGSPAPSPQMEQDIWSHAWPNPSPFEDVHLGGEVIDVFFKGNLYELASIDGVSTAEILAGAREQFGEEWEKRVADGFVDILDRLGHSMGDTVKLVLNDPKTEGTLTVERAPMAQSKRANELTSEYAFWEADAKQIRQVVTSFAEAAGEIDRDALAKTLSATYLNNAMKALEAGARIGEVRSIIPLRDHALVLTDSFDDGTGESERCVVYHCVRRDKTWLILDVELKDMAGLVALSVEMFGQAVPDQVYFEAAPAYNALPPGATEETGQSPQEPGRRIVPSGPIAQPDATEETGQSRKEPGRRIVPAGGPKAPPRTVREKVPAGAGRATDPPRTFQDSDGIR